MSYSFGKRSIQRMEGVHPYLVECAKNTISQSIYDLTIPWMGGVRTAQEQNDIHKGIHNNGVSASKCDGYEVLSYHQIEASNTGYGMALDIIPVGSNPYEETRKLNYIGRLMLINWQELIYKYSDKEDIGVMIWGGTFGASSWDRPHFEIR